MYDDVGVIFYNGIFGHILKKDNSFYIISIEGLKDFNWIKQILNFTDYNLRLYKNNIYYYIDDLGYHYVQGFYTLDGSFCEINIYGRDWNELTKILDEIRSI